MRRIVNDDKFSDITFLVGGGGGEKDKVKMYAHKVILAARCEVFQAMFTEQKKQAASSKTRVSVENIPLVLPDVRPSVFLTVLEFIYTNSCQLNSDIAIDVLASAVEYGLDGLANCCAQFVTKDLNNETASHAMQAAITYNQPDLRDTCLGYIEQNTSAVFRSKAFVEVSEDTFAFILQSDHLQADEKSILESVYHWGTVNSVVSGKTLGKQVEKVMEHVRFPLLDEASLHAIEEENLSHPKRQGTVPMRLIAKAWKYLATKRSDPKDPQFKARAGSHL